MIRLIIKEKSCKRTGFSIEKFKMQYLFAFYFFAASSIGLLLALK